MTYRRDNFDPNLNNIHAAMAYNSAGEPVLRVLTYGSGGAMDLTAFHVETLPAADGGALIYDNTTGVFLFTPYSLATASNSILGGVKVDGSTITINDGVISAPYTYTLPIATANSLGGVEIGTNISVDPSTGKISVSFDGLATETYVTNAITNNLNLGNFEINGTNLQTLSGTVNGADIILNPLNASVKVNSLKFGDLGSIVNTTLSIEAYITTYRLVHIVDYSTTDALPTGQYGNINGVVAPWTVFELAPGTSGTPVSAVAINDKLTGVGIVPSTVADRGLAGVGDPAEWNNYVIVNLDLSQLGQVLPIEGEAVFNLTRPLEKANLNIQSATGTDIFLDSQGLGDVIVNTNILPVATNVSNLGSPTRRWKAVYVGPGTIYVQDETLGNDIAIGARDGLLYIQNGKGLSVGEFTFVDNQIKITNPARDIIVGSSGATASVVFNRAIKVKDSLGNLAFEVDRSGLTTIRTPSGISYQNATLSIIGTANGHVQPRPVDYDGTLIQLTAQDGKSSRISSDSFGTGVYPLYAGRAAAGTVDVPTAVQSGAILSRFSGVGYGTTAYKTGIIRLDMLAAETFTDTAAGTKFSFQTTPTGSTAAQLSATINSTGITFVGTTDTTAGITFYNGDRLTYFPTPAGNTNYYLKSDGSTMSWQALPVTENPIIYKGAWNASTNASPVVIGTDGKVNGTVPTTGWEYSISVTGTQNIGNGSQEYQVGGFVIYDGTIWDYLAPNTGVASIKFDGGIVQTGAVQVVSSDIISTLDSNSIANAKLANSSVTVTAGTGLSGGGTVSLGNTITLSNTGVTSIVNGTGISVSGTGAVTVTNTGIVTLTGSTYIGVTSGSTPTVSLTNASNNDTINSVALRNSDGGLTAKDFTATLDAGLSTDHGPFNYGTLSYTDTSIMADFSYSTAGYNQIVLQNRYTGAAASTNYIVSNDQGTKDIFYGEFGMNSSGFSGTGSLALPNAVYLNSVSSDLVLGGTGIHFVIDGGIDALTINSSGTATFANTISGSITGNSGTADKVNHAITFAATGGASAGAIFDGSSAKTIDYHTVGAQVAGTYVTSVSGTSPISVTSGTTPQVSISQASGTTNGYLSSTDWTTFNNKSNTNGTVTSVTGNGVISVATGTTTPSISISQASGTTSGYLSSTDWTIFNNKTSNTGTVTSVAALTLTATGTDITSTVANSSTTPVITLNVPTASATNRGLLSSTDWTTFNNKSNTNGTVTSITASTTPVNGLSLSGGVITSTGTVAITGTLSGITNSNLSGTAGITNSNLANSSVTVTAGTGMSGGGSVSLGGSVTLANAGVTSIVAGSNISISGSTGAVTINSTGYGVGGNQLVYELNAPLTLSSVKNTLISLFGLTSGVALASNTRYQYELVFNMACNKNGTLSYALALNGGAVVAQHNYQVIGNKTATIDGYTAGVTMMSLNATGSVITTANPVQDINVYGHTVIYGIIDVTSAGSINFMISQDQNTPVTWSVLAGSYIKLLPLGAIGANTIAGTWA